MNWISKESKKPIKKVKMKYEDEDDDENPRGLVDDEELALQIMNMPR